MTTANLPVPVPSAAIAARDFIARGWCPIPVPHGKKAPRLKKWPTLRLTQRDAVAFFREESNIGVLLGDPSGGLVDVDLDCPDAVALADHFLPVTKAVFGREGRGASYRLYIAEGAKTAKYTTATGTIVEIRSTGCQTLFPPSVHPSGEPITWVGDGTPAVVDAASLVLAVARLAGASLLLRHWPGKGIRHDFAMALSGALLRCSTWNTTTVEDHTPSARPSSSANRPAVSSTWARKWPWPR